MGPRAPCAIAHALGGDDKWSWGDVRDDDEYDGFISAFGRVAGMGLARSRCPFSGIPDYSLGRTVKFFLALIALANIADDRNITVCHNDSNSLMILVASFTLKADDA
jgi:hypothetical protein